MNDELLASSGHKLGQIVGDWYEKYFALPLLSEVSEHLGLFIDNRYLHRKCRREKIIWKDSENNCVDYDFVLELNGNDNSFGVPVAFFETFWRRGARHSKDKARDDSGKLLPMRSTYPTARVLGIISAGDFTEPAREYVSSRHIELFYVPKEKIISAWRLEGLDIDYDDRAPEETKSELAKKTQKAIEKDPLLLESIASRLKLLVGESTLNSFKLLIHSKLSATPQEYIITMAVKSRPIVFKNYSDVDIFINQHEPEIDTSAKKITYNFDVVFGDGDTFSGENLQWSELRKRHQELKALVIHMENLV